MAHHGTFALGPTPRAALKAAVMLEDVAKTVHLALTAGQAETLASRAKSRSGGTATTRGTASRGKKASARSC